MEKLNVKALAVGVGISWAFCMLFVGWTSIFGWGREFVEMMSSVYPGFTPTLLGGIIGAIWGFMMVQLEEQLSPLFTILLQERDN